MSHNIVNKKIYLCSDFSGLAFLQYCFAEG